MEGGPTKAKYQKYETESISPYAWWLSRYVEDINMMLNDIMNDIIKYNTTNKA